MCLYNWKDNSNIHQMKQLIHLHVEPVYIDIMQLAYLHTEKIIFVDVFQLGLHFPFFKLSLDFHQDATSVGHALSLVNGKKRYTRLKTLLDS